MKHMIPLWSAKMYFLIACSDDLLSSFNPLIVFLTICDIEEWASMERGFFLFEVITSYDWLNTVKKLSFRFFRAWNNCSHLRIMGSSFRYNFWDKSRNEYLDTYFTFLAFNWRFLYKSLKHDRYSPYLALSDCYDLPQQLRKGLKGHKRPLKEFMIETVETWLF